MSKGLRLASIIIASAWIRAGAAVITPVAYPGLRFPDGSVAQSQNLYPMMSRDGVVTFTKGAAGTVGTHSIWSYDAGQLRPVAIAGGTVPDDSGAFYQYTEFRPYCEQGGPTAFTGTYKTPQNTYVEAAWVTDSGTTWRIMTHDGPAPGTAGASFANRPNVISVNPDGGAAFETRLEGGDTTSVNNYGVWMVSGSTSKLVARAGDQIPGQPPGTVWPTRYGYTWPIALPGGDVLIHTAVGSGGVGLWRTDGETATAIAISKQQVPGMPAGTKFGATIERPRTNIHGDLTFYDGRVWLKNESGFHIIAAVGDAAPDGGTFLGLDSSPHLTDDGQVIFYGRTTLTDDAVFRTGQHGLELIAGTGSVLSGLTIYRMYGETVGPNGEIAFIADVGMGGFTLNYLFGAAAGQQPELIAGAGTLLPTSPGNFMTVRSASLYSRQFSDFDLNQFDTNGNLVFTADAVDGSRAIFVAQLPEPTTLLLGSVILMTFMSRSFRRADRQHRRFRLAYFNSRFSASQRWVSYIEASLSARHELSQLCNGSTRDIPRHRLMLHGVGVR